MKKVKAPVHLLPVMPKHCATCPFKPDINGRWQDTELANTVISRNLFNSQQICHHPRTVNKPETHRCRGYYDFSYQIYERMGLDPENNLLNNPKK